jgi:signal peptidase I
MHVLVTWLQYAGICKRVRAVGGDKVTYTHPYDGAQLTLTVPRGHVWLEGDNPARSVDSRAYGSVSTRLIEGKVVLLLGVNPLRLSFVASKKK